jgi:hypothetical protein
MFKALLLFILLIVNTIKGIDDTKIRYGSSTNFKKGQTVSVVNSKNVYLQIKPYKTIIKEKVEKDSARWTKLMEEATSLYKNALAKSGYNLIVEIGGVDESLHKTADITQEIIDLL